MRNSRNLYRHNNRKDHAQIFLNKNDQNTIQLLNDRPDDCGNRFVDALGCVWIGSWPGAKAAWIGTSTGADGWGCVETGCEMESYPGGLSIAGYMFWSVFWFCSSSLTYCFKTGHMIWAVSYGPWKITVPISLKFNSRLKYNWMHLVVYLSNAYWHNEYVDHTCPKFWVNY